jgi:hypothetical protein
VGIHLLDFSIRSETAKPDILGAAGERGAVIFVELVEAEACARISSRN